MLSILRDYKGKKWERERVPGSEKCKDCGKAPEHYHKPGCNMEPCPACGEQLLSCDCDFMEASYQVFDDNHQLNPLEDAVKFASDKDVISISTHQHQGIYKMVLMVTVFYWR